MPRDQAEAALRRDKIVAALRALDGAGMRARAERAWGALRRRSDVVLAALLLGGVLAMILHWG